MPTYPWQHWIDLKATATLIAVLVAEESTGMTSRLQHLRKAHGRLEARIDLYLSQWC